MSATVFRYPLLAALLIGLLTFGAMLTVQSVEPPTYPGTIVCIVVGETDPFLKIHVDDFQTRVEGWEIEYADRRAVLEVPPDVLCSFMPGK